MHDELLMQGMADASGGNYYYVDSPGDMVAIFQKEAGSILRTAARSTDIDLPIPPGLVLEEVIGYDYVTADGRVYVRLGSVPHDEERFVAFRFASGGGGPVPMGIVYSDLARRGRFGVIARPATSRRRVGVTTGRSSWPAAPRPPGASRNRWRGPTPAERCSSSRSSATRAA